jgi:hypothetical protein
MDDKQNSRQTPYNGERSTTPHHETGDSTLRNNNVDVSTPGAAAPNVEGANDAGIGDAAVNDQKLTSRPSNHSADA